MSFSIYDASLPVFARALTSLSGVLAKGEAHAEARKIAPEVFLNARLAPDMFPLSKQVQVASDMAKGGAARLAGADLPAYPDDEKTFAELQARITKTIDFVQSFNPAHLAGAETRQVVLKSPTRELTFTGQTYLLNFVLPNLYFHVTTAYDILRHNGVELGKMDFIGGL